MGKAKIYTKHGRLQKRIEIIPVCVYMPRVTFILYKKKTICFFFPSMHRLSVSLSLYNNNYNSL